MQHVKGDKKTEEKLQKLTQIPQEKGSVIPRHRGNVLKKILHYDGMHGCHVPRHQPSIYTLPRLYSALGIFLRVKGTPRQ